MQTGIVIIWMQQTRNLEKEKTSTDYNVMLREWELRKRSKTIKETHTHGHTGGKLAMEFQQVIIMIIMWRVHCVIMISNKKRNKK